MAHEHAHGSNDDGAPLLVKILTVSDGVIHGSREDKSGAILDDHMTAAGWTVTERTAVEDGTESVAAALRSLANGFHGLIITTGGTGFGPRDLTPEGTRSVVDREAPGLAEAMRLASPLGRLSRAVAGTLDTALVVNTPGSSKGCVETIDAVIDVLPHAVRLMVDNADPHPSADAPNITAAQAGDDHS
ncbi:MAG: molybdopterin adenylyltransferase [Candidatus Aldehydirespiratoraceae bacterium]|jgi:molybdopterin adenylyltransferase